MADFETFWREDPAPLLRVEPGFVLTDVDTDGTPGFSGRKRDSVDALDEGAEVLATLQEKFFADSTVGGTRSVLLVLQAMDTAGKGGIVKHVVGSVDPGGVHLHAFKAPTEEELAHDFLWRVRRQVPVAGQIGVFDRSHYEDVLIGSVRKLAPDDVIEQRFRDIAAFEQELVANGTVIVKVMLHISSDEQKARLAARLERPDKHWKYNPGDVTERLRWNDYQAAYQRVFDETSTTDAPWFVVPANRKWYARLAVQHLLIDALRLIDPQWPKPDYDVEVEKARLAAS
ncbi:MULTISPECIES: PPK2 family polyphosphate kinase [unclassified Leifsonia]|uniref:PPK2 family polyphosphate kinase n=1 Tax=unclassified Leifsonia TaxID=2663824 RepID=UPI0006F7D6EF|nr:MULTISPECIES: PPK2 family polyphosphate kinase [unclassified Leifsonia]KQX05341.1 phosphate--nucleotide phosphotransferase [Leifsonia sp. Root1293]KRA08973.1 phosphate--nucleotide phosphotransferase [Leifsonia sp. Root60]